MSAEQWDALRAPSQQDQKLLQVLAGAKSAGELVAVANQQGFDINSDNTHPLSRTAANAPRPTSKSSPAPD